MRKRRAKTTCGSVSRDGDTVVLFICKVGPGVDTELGSIIAGLRQYMVYKPMDGMGRCTQKWTIHNQALSTWSSLLEVAILLGYLSI